MVTMNTRANIPKREKINNNCVLEIQVEFVRNARKEFESLYFIIKLEEEKTQYNVRYLSLFMVCSDLSRITEKMSIM